MPIGDRYVEVDASALFAFLESKGFERTVPRREVVYTRAHAADPRYRVLVYTSVAAGSDRARRRAADAIRVCAVYTPDNGPTRGVVKLPKVLRTGSQGAVFERVLGRMRTAYATCTERINQDRVRHRPVQEADLHDEDGETLAYRAVHGEDGR